MADSNPETRKVKKSLKYSILDGSAYSAMLGLTQDYIAPFALALKATTAQIGLLASVPNLAMSMSQLPASQWFEEETMKDADYLPQRLQEPRSTAVSVSSTTIVSGDATSTGLQ